MIKLGATTTRKLLTGLRRIFGMRRKVLFIVILLIVIVLLITAFFIPVHYQPESIELQFSIQATSEYDLNGDGFVSEADLIIYRDTLHRIDFDNNGQVDIFDQTMLAYEVVDVNTLYLPIIFKNR